VLKKICWYAVLAPSYSTDEGSSSDVATLVATTAAYKQLGDLPLHKQLLATFTNPEIIRWGLFEAQYGPEIKAEVRRVVVVVVVCVCVCVCVCVVVWGGGGAWGAWLCLQGCCAWAAA
jgi:hypothetical protein